MNDLEKAARQALEVLENRFNPKQYGEMDNAITALRKALGQQPKQKPVAWWNPKKDTVSCDPVHRHHPDCVPLYTEPPKHKEGCAECGKLPSDGWALYCVKCSEPMREWVGLTDKEIDDFMEKAYQKVKKQWIERELEYYFARSIEAKLKELNT